MAAQAIQQLESKKRFVEYALAPDGRVSRPELPPFL